MLPFFNSWEKVEWVSVKLTDIRIGDIITFMDESEHLVTHRVVRILDINGELKFLTKGDNHVTWDPVVAKDRVVGKVIRIGDKDLTSRRWCRLGRILACISHSQAVIYHALAGCRLNRVRHWIERKGWCPRLPHRFWFQRAFHLLCWLIGTVTFLSQRR
jgi:hypothetical protein